MSGRGPVGGSFFMEALTDDLLVKAREILAAVDENGGMRAHVESAQLKGASRLVPLERRRASTAARTSSWASTTGLPAVRTSTCASSTTPKPWRSSSRDSRRFGRRVIQSGALRRWMR